MKLRMEWVLKTFVKNRFKEKTGMKATLKTTAMALVAMLMFVGPAGAGFGNGGSNGMGAGDGTGPVHDIYAGIPFEYGGDVTSMVPGQGLVLSTADGDVAIYGIGPYRYWDGLGVEHPVVGDTLTVSGYAVDYNGVVRNIAVTVTVGDATVELRDEAGAPLWRGGSGSSGWNR